MIINKKEIIKTLFIESKYFIKWHSTNNNDIWNYKNIDFIGIWKNGIWENGIFKVGDWNNGIWKKGEIYSKKFNRYIGSKVNPIKFYKIEAKCNTIKQLESKIQ